MEKQAGEIGNAYFCEHGNFVASSLHKALGMILLEYGDLPVTASLLAWDSHEAPISCITYKRDETGKVVGLELS